MAETTDAPRKTPETPPRASGPTSDGAGAAQLGRGGWSVRLALAWSAITAVLAVLWATGLAPHPFHDPGAVAMGALFNTVDPMVGIAVAFALGVVGTVCGVAALRVRERAAGRAVVGVAWLLAAVAALALVYGRLITIFGYTLIVPVVGWFVPGLGAGYVEAMRDPENLAQLHWLAGGLLWGAAALYLGRALRGACRACGRSAGWSQLDDDAVRARALRVGRVAVAVAVACALCYPAVRLPWLFGVGVGMDADTWAALQADEGTVAIGVGLGVAGLAGAVLILGLVARWGVRFPRWMVGLAGRRVPVSLAVVPAAAVALAFVAVGRGFTFGLLIAGSETPIGAYWVHVAALVAMLPWGVALGVATVAYAVRRRAICRVCGQGSAEREPREIAR